jgi:hypothetical protein
VAHKGFTRLQQNEGARRVGSCRSTSSSTGDKESCHRTSSHDDRHHRFLSQTPVHHASVKLDLDCLFIARHTDDFDVEIWLRCLPHARVRQRSIRHGTIATTSSALDDRLLSVTSLIRNTVDNLQAGWIVGALDIATKQNRSKTSTSNLIA